MSTNGDSPPDKETILNKVEATEKEEQIHTLPKKEYDALVRERDQLKINLYMLGTNLKEVGFQVSDNGNGVQKLGNDIVTRIKLSPEQLAMIQRQIQQ